MWEMKDLFTHAVMICTASAEYIGFRGKFSSAIGSGQMASGTECNVLVLHITEGP
jgi:hypothetical protein